MKMMTDQLNEKFEELKEALESISKKRRPGIDGRLFYYYL